jgi:ribosomal protein L18E
MPDLRLRAVLKKLKFCRRDYELEINRVLSRQLEEPVHERLEIRGMEFMLLGVSRISIGG